jgi:2Fe-2S ferredoxin
MVDNGPTRNDTCGIVTVEPSGARLELRAGESLMDAAHRYGYGWPSICGGDAECRACHVFVRQGADNLVPPERLEASSLAALAQAGAGTLMAGPDVRLACQLQAHGPVTVLKRGWKPRITRAPQDRQTQPDMS